MKRSLLIFTFLFYAAFFNISAQHNFIGRNKDEIAGIMKESYNNFKLNKDVINRTYKYLKYEDKISEQTVLFFLSDGDKCTLVRWMSDYSNINEMIASLDKNYHKTGKKSWEYTDQGKEYSVVLEDGEWFFTVTFKLKTNK